MGHEKLVNQPMRQKAACCSEVLASHTQTTFPKAASCCHECNATAVVCMVSKGSLHLKLHGRAHTSRRRDIPDLVSHALQPPVSCCFPSKHQQMKSGHSRHADCSLRVFANNPSCKVLLACQCVPGFKNEKWIAGRSTEPASWQDQHFAQSNWA